MSANRSTHLRENAPDLTLMLRFSQSLASVATESAAKHMVQALVEWFQSCVEQAGDRDADCYHSTTSYFANRRANIGTEPSFAIYELGLTLPDTVWHDPTILVLRRLAADMTIYANVSIFLTQVLNFIALY